MIGYIHYRNKLLVDFQDTAHLKVFLKERDLLFWNLLLCYHSKHRNRLDVHHNNLLPASQL